MKRIEAYIEAVKGKKIVHRDWIGTGKHVFAHFNNDGKLEFRVQLPSGKTYKVNGDMQAEDFYLVEY